jgi:hypothetical protein
MGTLDEVDYNLSLTLCLPQSRLQHIYQAWATLCLESTLSLSEGLRSRS